jgi:DNA invertase Pin-like site-specific DNA recombinase
LSGNLDGLVPLMVPLLPKPQALARRKAQGLPLGRPKGAKAKKVKLDEHRETIISYLKKGVSKLSIAKIIECSPSTLYAWIDRNRLESYVRRKG